METEKNTKRIVIDVPTEWHTKIKIRAAEMHVTIQRYVMKALYEQFKKEKDLGWDEIK